jgi:hypothetical protein
MRNAIVDRMCLKRAAWKFDRRIVEGLIKRLESLST